MLKSINTLEKAREYDFTERSDKPWNGKPAVNVGQYDYARPDSESSKNFREVLVHILGICANI